MDGQDDKLVIKSSKIKIVLLVAGALAFVLVGAFFLIVGPEEFSSGRRSVDPGLFYLIGSAAVLFFGACLIFGIRKLFDSQPGLVLDANGIYDNSTGVSVGFVPWDDVVDIGRLVIVKQKFVVVIVRNPEKYTETGNKFARMTKRANASRYKSPVHISANTLQIKFEELEGKVAEYFKRYANPEDPVTDGSS